VPIIRLAKFNPAKIKTIQNAAGAKKGCKVRSLASELKTKGPRLRLLHKASVRGFSMVRGSGPGGGRGLGAARAGWVG